MRTASTTSSTPRSRSASRAERSHSERPALLEGVQPDRRAFRDDLLQAHLRATKIGGGALVALLSSLAVAAALALKALLGALLGLAMRALK